jgi:competence protein ComEC
MTVDRWRNELAERIIGVIGGDAGAVAAALVTGKRGMISEETNEALRAAGIYHIVSISGLHMVLAAGMVFWLTRLLIVLVPTGRLSIPAKPIAAIAAILGAAAYTVFAGAEVATIRSMIMTMVLFGSILAGRPAISIRNLAIAAILVILVEPETLLGPSFQMSFAAVAAMIAVYERLPPSADRPAQFSTSQETVSEPPKSTSGRIFGRFVRYAKILAITTLIAQAATGPFAAFHFQQFQTWGLIGNTLTLPLVELVAMPIALGAVLALPFGADEIFWQAMGLSMEGMLGFAEMVASWPYAVQALPAIPVLSLLCLSIGLIWLTFWSTPLRWGGIGFVLAGLVAGLDGAQPDVIVSRDGRAIAVRGADGLLTIAGLGASDFVVKQWLLADGDLRKPDDPFVRRNGFCDLGGCVVRLANGKRVALALRTRALNEDCRTADLVVTPLTKPNDCRAETIDGVTLRQTGALELYSNGEGYRINASRPAGYNAPWSKNPDLKGAPTKDIESPNELNAGETDPEPQEKPEPE